MSYRRNLKESELINLAKNNENCVLLKNGVLCSFTGDATGRSPNAKYYVKDNQTKDKIDWSNNKAISKKDFNKILDLFLEFNTKNKKNIHLQTVAAVRDSRRSFKVNVYTEYAKHALFTRNMFITSDFSEDEADYSVYHFPSLLDDPAVLVSIEKKIILISGTLYSGEIKKSVFSILNYHFPENNELPMHCSVNVDKDRGNAAIFFGLSGTGKTTLSSDPSRVLIGDDEHAWTSNGLTNFEGGCYAKTVKLSKEGEPQIWDACHTPGTILENVVIRKDHTPDFDDITITENGRASYPTSFIAGADAAGFVDIHPRNIIMLTCDAFGVLPAVAKLSAEEAIEQFLLGYTAKVAGTEKGIVEPQATFSPCFGLPFMPLKPSIYADILKQKILEHDVDCWLVNTGWSGGSYGIGERIALNVTRTIIDGILSGELSKQPTINHSKSGFSVPMYYKVSSEYLIPEMKWDNRQNYLSTLKTLKDKISAYKKK